MSFLSLAKYFECDPSADVGESRHVHERKNGPAPRIRLASDRHQGSGTLSAQCEEDHNGHGGREGKDRPAVGPLSVLHLGLETFAFMIFGRA